MNFSRQKIESMVKENCEQSFASILNGDFGENAKEASFNSWEYDLLEAVHNGMNHEIDGHNTKNGDSILIDPLTMMDQT